MTRAELEVTREISKQIIDANMNLPEAEAHNEAHGWRIESEDGSTGWTRGTGHMIRLAYWHAARPHLYPLHDDHAAPSGVAGGLTPCHTLGPD